MLFPSETQFPTEGTTVSFEYPNFNNEPFYPIPNSRNDLLYEKYRAEAKKLKNVYFLGRLAEYKYYNMDQVVAKTLMLIEKLR